MDFKRLARVEAIEGETAQETAELRELYESARQYLTSHDWCDSVADAYMGFAVAGVVGVFLVRVNFTDGSEEWLWLVEGDLPSAYLVTDRAAHAADALKVYAELMEDWVKAVRAGDGVDDVFPVDAPADEEHAAMLQSRVNAIRRDVIPLAEEW